MNKKLIENKMQLDFSKKKPVKCKNCNHVKPNHKWFPSNYGEIFICAWIDCKCEEWRGK